MGYVDMHIHSKYSDGVLSPQEIIDYHKVKGTKLISITDHNTVDAYFQKFDTGNMKLITGVEIDINYMPEIQCLCYGFDYENERILKALKDIQAGRMKAKVKLVRKLLSLKIIDHTEISKICALNDFNSICLFLSRKMGDCLSDDVRTVYFRRGGEFYQKIPLMELEDCISMVHQAGGVVLLAHPGRIHVSKDDLYRLFDELLYYGIDGFECYHPEHDRALCIYIKEYCRRHHCLFSGGSDMHGESTEYVIPENLIDSYWGSDYGNFRY